MEVEGGHEMSSPSPDPPTRARSTGCDSEAAAAPAESSAAAPPTTAAAPMSADEASTGDVSHVTASPAAAAVPVPSESLAEIPVPKPRSISDMEMAVLQVSPMATNLLV